MGIGVLTLPADMDLEIQTQFKRAVGYYDPSN
jgi:hypothetical protein